MNITFKPINLATTCLSLNLIILNTQISRVHAQNIVLTDKFDAAFIIISPGGAVASHQSSSLSFGQQGTALNSNYSIFSPLTLNTNLQKVTSNSYDLNFLLATGSNSGFIPPGTTLRGQAVNEWRFDLGNFFSGSDNGLDFPNSVIYNSVQGSWFDDGKLVFQTSYLPQINIGSTPNRLVGQFEIRLASGDLGAFGNGIDTFALKVNLTPTVKPIEEVPEPSSISTIIGAIFLYNIIRNGRKKILIYNSDKVGNKE